LIIIISRYQSSIFYFTKFDSILQTNNKTQQKTNRKKHKTQEDRIVNQKPQTL